MNAKVKDIIKLLEANGWVEVRMRGDHRIFKKMGATNNVTVPGRLNDELPDGTELSILRKAGLRRIGS